MTNFLCYLADCVMGIGHLPDALCDLVWTGLGVGEGEGYEHVAHDGWLFEIPEYRHVRLIWRLFGHFDRYARAKLVDDWPSVSDLMTVPSCGALSTWC
jgi:hypothetical protein